MTTTITNLYKQVFNNRYINRIIYNYVQYHDNENSEDYEKLYDQITNSYNIVDLEIGQLLKKKQYKLLGSMIDNYFKYVSNNQHSYKYWYYTLNPNKDILKLLKWRELGFERFKLLYNEFTWLFELNKLKTLKSSCIGGNLQIFQFLLNKNGDGDDGCGYTIETNSNFEWKDICKLYCGGNLEIFQFLLNRFSNSNFNSTININLMLSLVQIIHKSYNNNYLHNYKDFDWVSESPSFTFQYYEIYKYLVELSRDKLNIMATTIYRSRLEDLSLGRIIVELMNENIDGGLKFCENFKNDNKIGIIIQELKTNNLMISSGKYNVFSYMFNNLNNKEYGNGKMVDCKLEDLIIFHSNSKIIQNRNIYRFNLNCIGIDIEELLFECINNGYYPNSIQEFNFIQLNEKFNEKLNSFKSQLIIHIANKLYDLDYLKLVFQYYFKNEITRGNCEFIKPYMNSLIGSTFEIVSWVFESFIYNSGIQYQIEKNISIFKGDIRIFNLLLPFRVIPDHYHIDTIVSCGHFDLFIRELEKPENIDKGIKYLQHVLELVFVYNQFEMYKYLLDSRPEINNLNMIFAREFGKRSYPLYTILYFAYFINKTNGTENTFQPQLIVNNTRECILKSIYLMDQISISNEGFTYFTYMLKRNLKPITKIQLHSTKVLEYLISNKTISVKNILNHKKTVSFLIGSNNIKKFIYLLNRFDQECKENGDINGNSLLSIKNYGFIIKKSISTNNYLILNYIINLKSSDSIFKNQFYLYFLFYSILLVNRKNNCKFNSIGNSITLNQFYNYYTTISDTDKFNLDFSNLINFKDQFESQQLYLDNLSTHIKRNEYTTSKSLYNLTINNLNLLIIKQQLEQHLNNNFVNFLINLNKYLLD